MSQLIQRNIMSKKSANKAILELGLLGNISGKVGGVVFSKRGIIRGSVHRKNYVRQKKVDK